MNQETNDDFLVHEGILGMHWHDRRFQNYDGSLTDEGRKRYGIGPPRMSKAEKLNIKKKKQQERNLAKARNAKKKAAKQEAREAKNAENLAKKKQAIFERGDVKEIYKNRTLFTTDEYQKAIQRAEMFDRSKPQKESKTPKSDDGKMRSFQLMKDTSDKSSAAKEKIINSGDPKLVRKNISKLNDQELRSAIEHIKGKAEIDGRIKNAKDLKKLEKAQDDRQKTSNGKSATEMVLKQGGNISSLFKTGTEAYNNYNMFAASINKILGEDKLPVFQATATAFTTFNKQLQDKAEAERKMKDARKTLNASTIYNYSTNGTQTVFGSPTTSSMHTAQDLANIFNTTMNTNMGNLTYTGTDPYQYYTY